MRHTNVAVASMTLIIVLNGVGLQALTLIFVSKFRHRILLTRKTESKR